MTGIRRALGSLFNALEVQPEAPATVVCAESLSAGLLAASIASIPGASRYLWGGMVSYQKESKECLLGVSAVSIVQYGLVSEAVAREMALGALSHSSADIAIALTGEAGPRCEGLAPKGRVWMALAHVEGRCEARSFDFRGSRNSIRRQAVRAAIRELLLFVEKTGHDPMLD